MDAKQKFQNDPAKFFLYQDKLLSTEERQRAAEYSGKILNLKICPVCDLNFDLASRAPRILIHCGHTVCTACLYLFFKDQRIRCPLCSKIIKRLRFLEILPLNHQIYHLLHLKTRPNEIDPINSTLRLPSEMTEEFEGKEDYEFWLCGNHVDRFMHFACLHCNVILCRLCITEKVHNCDYNIIDLYSLPHDTVKQILSKLLPSNHFLDMARVSE